MLQEFKDIYTDRYRFIKEQEEQGKKVMGWVCTYVPEEMIYAAGMLPIRITGWAGDTSVADGYLYSNVCSFARGCLEEGLKGNYDFLSGYVAVNSCDNLRRLFEVWSRYCKTPFTHIIKLPHKITEDSIAYFRDELFHLKERLEEFTGKEITDGSLQTAINLYNRTRQLLRRLYELRKANSPPISGAETLDVVLAGLVMPRELYNQRLEALLNDLAGKEKKDGDKWSKAQDINKAAAKDIIEIAIPFKLMKVSANEEVQFIISVARGEEEIERWPGRGYLSFDVPTEEFEAIRWCV